VLQADGGTRTAASPAPSSPRTTPSKLIAAGKLRAPIAIRRRDLGRHLQGVPVLDLDYAEDSRCDTDMNVDDRPAASSKSRAPPKACRSRAPN
jgi:ribonuclease PH